MRAPYWRPFVAVCDTTAMPRRHRSFASARKRLRAGLTEGLGLSRRRGPVWCSTQRALPWLPQQAVSQIVLMASMLNKYLYGYSWFEDVNPAGAIGKKDIPVTTWALGSPRF